MASGYGSCLEQSHEINAGSNQAEMPILDPVGSMGDLRGGSYIFGLVEWTLAAREAAATLVRDQVTASAGR